MWELFKARTGAAAPLLKKIKLPGKQTWCHRLFPNAGESCTFCKSVSEFHQLFCTSTSWRPFPGADLWNSPWSSWESDTFTSSAKHENDRTAWPLRQKKTHRDTRSNQSIHMCLFLPVWSHVMFSWEKVKRLMKLAWLAWLSNMHWQF